MSEQFIANKVIHVKWLSSFFMVDSPLSWLHAIRDTPWFTHHVSRKRITTFSIGLSKDHSFFILSSSREGFLLIPEFANLWTGEVR